MSRVTPRLPGFSVSLLLVKAEPAYSSTPFLRGCLLASRPPEGCGERPINGLHVSNNQCPPAGGERSVVINGGYSLGIACRIDPSLQAICNSDSAKLTVNRRCGLIATIFLDTGPRLANNGARDLNQTEENPHSGWHHVTRQ